MSEAWGFSGPDYEPPYREKTFKVEWHNIETNQWDFVAEFNDKVEAFEYALEQIGKSKIHDTVCLLEDDDEVWNSETVK